MIGRRGFLGRMAAAPLMAQTTAGSFKSGVMGGAGVHRGDAVSSTMELDESDVYFQKAERLGHKIMDGLEKPVIHADRMDPAIAGMRSWSAAFKLSVFRQQLKDQEAARHSIIEMIHGGNLSSLERFTMLSDLARKMGIHG